MPRWVKKLIKGPLSPIAARLFDAVAAWEHRWFDHKWKKAGEALPDEEEIDLVCQNVTVIYKSFERQKMAKRLYKNLQTFYPGIRVIIADDSAEPLRLQDDPLTVIQLPFNSGLSYGLNKALERVETPYVLRMDDDELLTRRTKLTEQLLFLQRHSEVDLVGFCVLNTIRCKDPDQDDSRFTSFSMRGAPMPLRIPHMTQIDGNHFVMGKVPNIILVRTEQLRKVGWDDQIRMMDHQDFFWRAAGHLVSVIALGTAVFHDHNPFDRHYQRYRQDVEGDLRYIADKRRQEENRS